MKKGIKISLITASIIILLVTSSLIITFIVIKKQHEPIPLNLDDAPKEIQDIRDNLRAKMENGTFTWDDMSDFVIFSQYVADNSPEILEIVKDWEEIVLFEITDQEENMWLIIGNNSLIFEIGANHPTNYGIFIELDFATMLRIMKREISPQKAFQKGDLKFEGKFSNVLDVNQIVEIAAATLMGTYTQPIEISDNFTITSDIRGLYEKNGLTLLPYTKLDIIPGYEGQHHGSMLVSSKAIIVDTKGQIVTELENSAHTVHKFINSTTVAMGGQGGTIELWNYKNGIVKPLEVPAGHHEFDYNPETDTLMVLDYVYSNETWDGLNILYDKMTEYTLEGEIIWEWDGRVHFPFNATRHTSLGINQTFRGGADWMHSNSFAWDKDEEVIYLTVRNLDTILKIDYNTKEILWQTGRLCNFTIYDSKGEEKSSLFHQPHGLEKIGENRFIIFDNDLYNESNPSTMNIETAQGHSRFLEFEINEDEQTMSEIWSWTPEDETYYFPESGGDADRLPDGNTLGIFGNKGLVLNLRDPTIITEVAQNGEIAWELTINGLNNTYFWVQRLERFYETPLIEMQEKYVNLTTGEISLKLTTWNSYKIDAKVQGLAKILVDKELVYQEELEFLPNWQPVNLEISIQNVPANAKVIQLIIENQDGTQTIEELYNSRGGAGKKFLVIGLPILGGGVVIAVTVLVWLKIKKSKLPKE